MKNNTNSPTIVADVRCALVSEMATRLAVASLRDGLDLGDERDCIADLRLARYGEGAIRANLEASIETARAAVVAFTFAA